VSATSTIEWTEATWNPVTGCTKISPGCKHCYAQVFAERWRGIPGHHFEQGFDMRLWATRLELPLTWKRPRKIFVNSMSDLFHDKVPLTFIREVFATMRAAHWHTFQVLTKRAERLEELSARLEWPSNVWMGVSVENERYVPRISHLRRVPSAVRFISFEPLLGPIRKPDLTGIHWAIAGGESGPGARPVDAQWVRDIRDHCQKSGTAFFFKQWGGVQKKKTGRRLDGIFWNEMPKSDGRSLAVAAA